MGSPPGSAPSSPPERGPFCSSPSSSVVRRPRFSDTAGMFLRRKTNEVRGVGYSYWNLCETIRTARGPRQRVVASPGKLEEAQLAGLRGGWADLTASTPPWLTTPGCIAPSTTSARTRTGGAPTSWSGTDSSSPQAQRGYSRDHRSDCKQVCIGLVCTPEGLPLSCAHRSSTTRGATPAHWA